jgi:GxxExxY protein
MELRSELRSGLDEKLYERATAMELKWCGQLVKVRPFVPVYFRGELIGNLIPDLIVKPKVVVAFNETHVAQNVGCLNIPGLQSALLLNFKKANLGWKRLINQSIRENSRPPDLHSKLFPSA